MFDGPNKNVPYPPPADSVRTEPIRPTTRFIIEAPDYLGFDQNFYDQEPFVLTIESLSRIVDLGEEYRALLRKILTEGLTYPSFTQPVYGWQQGMSREEVTEDSVLRVLNTRRFSSTRIALDKRPYAASVIAREILGLLEYPFIEEYVGNQIWGGGYASTGKISNTPRNANPDGSGTKTYAKWLKDKVEREGRMLGLEVKSLVFGDDETAPTSTVHKSGHRSGWRKWAILKASEITNPHP